MLVDFDTLANFAGTRKVKAVAMWCARNRIHTFRDTKGRPVTTIAAIERALGQGDVIEPNYDPPPARSNNRPKVPNGRQTPRK